MIEVVFPGGINLPLTLDCGQAFRWKRNNDGTWTGIAYNTIITAEDLGRGRVRFEGVDDNSFADVFADYFDYYRDYTDVMHNISHDAVLAPVVEKYGAVRILNQDPWECLVTFIFSACNNIPRIKGIVERFCSVFGESSDGENFFPSPDIVANSTEEDFAPVRAGFRTPYVISAAEAVVNGEIDLNQLRCLPLAKAEQELMHLNGVGKKVADCTLLFSLHHSEAFPVDRHIARFTEAKYPAGLPEYFRGIEGIAQQYMFIAQRELKNENPT